MHELTNRWHTVSKTLKGRGLGLENTKSADLETVPKKMRLGPNCNISKKSTILALLLRNFDKMTSS